MSGSTDGLADGLMYRAGDGALWRLTLQYSPVGMTLVGLDGRLLMVNDALCTMLGRSVEELTRLGFQELTHPDDLGADLELFEQAVNGEIDSYRMTKRYLHGDGHYVWGDLSGAIVRAADGEPLHFISQILDVTEQQTHRQQLEAATAEVERERQKLEAIFETVHVGLLLVGRDGSYERMNRQHAETMRLPFPQGHHGVAGQVGAVYLLDGSTPMTREQMPSYRAAQGEEFDDFIYWVGEDPYTRAAFSASARQVRDSSGAPLGAALAYQEITELMRAMRARDAFVSSVSHELRTPLTSVLGHLEILAEREDLPPDVEHQVRIVHRNALRLQALVSDVLHVAQAGEGSLQLQRAEVDLAAVVLEAVEAARPVAEQQGVAVLADTPPQLRTIVDQRRLRQVVDNLLANAIKYTPAGGQAGVSLHEITGETGAAEIELVVVDTGIGIAAEELERVFDRFFRSDSAVATHKPGTGLGLNIVSTIVAAHGGAVVLTSELGAGSTFRVTLPRMLP